MLFTPSNIPCQLRQRELNPYSRSQSALPYHQAMPQYLMFIIIFKRLRHLTFYDNILHCWQCQSHCRLNSSYQSHQFQWLLANSYLELHRFHFITFCLADFTDCGLLELQLLLLSHILPCELYMCSYYRTISDFSVSKSYTLLLYSLSLINSSFPI